MKQLAVKAQNVSNIKGQDSKCFKYLRALSCTGDLSCVTNREDVDPTSKCNNYFNSTEKNQKSIPKRIKGKQVIPNVNSAGNRRSCCLDQRSAYPESFNRANEELMVLNNEGFLGSLFQHDIQSFRPILTLVTGSSWIFKHVSFNL